MLNTKPLILNPIQNTKSIIQNFKSIILESKILNTEPLSLFHKSIIQSIKSLPPKF